MSRKRVHPDSKLTLRQCFEKHYDRSDLTHFTELGYRHKLNFWERHSSNPPVGKITNETLAKFRQHCLDSGLAPASVNGVWSYLRAIFRRIGPKFTGNPQGLGIIADVPWMKLVKCSLPLPKRVDLEDIARVYVAARHMRFPRCGIEPTAFWRCMIVLAYCTGLRRSDLFSLRWSQFQLEAATFTFYARKTGKGGESWPLHPVAVEHLKRIREPGEGRVFRGMLSNGSGSYTKSWRKLLSFAGIHPDDPRYFTLHDLRRTGGSEIDRVAKGMGWVFTQHAPRSVFERSYLNCMEELRDALEKMRLPAGFRSGPKVAERKLEEARKARMTQADFVPPGPNPADWEFRPGAFCFRGTWFPMKSAARMAVLKLLANSAEPVPESKIAEVGGSAHPGRARFRIWKIRQRLRSCLGLHPSHDPIPCIQTGKNQTAYTLWIPPEIGRGQKAS